MKKLLTVPLIALLALSLTACSASDYKNASELARNGQYSAAGEAYEALGDYKDSAELAKTMYYFSASAAMDSGDYDSALTLFDKADGFADSAEKICSACYSMAVHAAMNDDYEQAIALFEQADGFLDSENRIKGVCYQYALVKQEEGDFVSAAALFERAQDYSDAEEKLSELKSRMLVNGSRCVSVDITDNVNAMLSSDYMKEASGKVTAVLTVELGVDGVYTVSASVSDEEKHELCNAVVDSVWSRLYPGLTEAQIKSIRDCFWNVTQQKEYELPSCLSLDDQLTLMYDSKHTLIPLLRRVELEITGSYTVEGSALKLYDKRGDVIAEGSLSGNELKIEYLNADMYSDMCPLSFY